MVEVQQDLSKKTLDNSVEDYTVVAQRFLNIFRQIRLLTPERKRAFDEEILALPPEVRGMFGKLLGGSSLQEYVDELEIRTGNVSERDNTQVVVSDVPPPATKVVDISYQPPNYKVEQMLTKILENSQKNILANNQTQLTIQAQLLEAVKKIPAQPSETIDTGKLENAINKIVKSQAELIADSTKVQTEQLSRLIVEGLKDSYDYSTKSILDALKMMNHDNLETLRESFKLYAERNPQKVVIENAPVPAQSVPKEEKVEPEEQLVENVEEPEILEIEEEPIQETVQEAKEFLEQPKSDKKKKKNKKKNKNNNVEILERSATKVLSESQKTVSEDDIIDITSSDMSFDDLGNFDDDVISDNKVWEWSEEPSEETVKKTPEETHEEEQWEWVEEPAVEENESVLTPGTSDDEWEWVEEPEQEETKKTFANAPIKDFVSDYDIPDDENIQPINEGEQDEEWEYEEVPAESSSNEGDEWEWEYIPEDGENESGENEDWEWEYEEVSDDEEHNPVDDEPITFEEEYLNSEASDVKPLPTSSEALLNNEGIFKFETPGNQPADKNFNSGANKSRDYILEDLEAL